jgi:phosphatidyl-myo-inositol dimannoside synthase
MHGNAGKIRTTCLGAATLRAGHGGIARVARMSARALIEAGYGVQLIALLDKEPAEFHRRCFYACHGSKFRFLARTSLATLSADRVLYDSVGLAKAHRYVGWWRRPYAVWVHGVEIWEGLRQDHKRSIRHADVVLANSQYTLDRHQNNHGPIRTGRVCWLATEQDAPPRIRANFAGSPTVLMVARLDATEGLKGHDELLSCWPQVASAVPDAQLVIVGGGSGLEAVRDRARTSTKATTIHVPGFVAEAAMHDLFERAHVFAMPSKQEGFGIVYVEAMRYGLPIIASVHDAGQEINVDKVTGYNVDLNRRDELAERLIELLTDTDRAAAFGEAGFRRWQNHFTYSSFARRFLAHWRASLDAQGPSELTSSFGHHCEPVRDKRVSP